jgi:transcriptional regulator with GAF, ATPase, and Fis domain
MQPLMPSSPALQRELDDARRQLAEQRRPKYTIASYIGSSPAALEVKRQARRVASRRHRAAAGRDRHRQGAAGARHPRRQPARRQTAFVGVNIAAVPETLLEAEFFGVAPAPTPAPTARAATASSSIADGGTLFLDEIGDMPLALQSKLLRVLQEQEFEPLGSNRSSRSTCA